MLYLYRRVVFGKLTKEDLMSIKDMNMREIAIFAPLVILVLWMGIYPSTFLDPIEVSVQKVVSDYQTALAAGAPGVVDVASAAFGWAK